MRQEEMFNPGFGKSRHATQDFCLNAMGDKSIDAMGFPIPLKERVRGMRRADLESCRFYYLTELDVIRSHMLTLRQTFGTKPYRRGSASVTLHAWTARQATDTGLPQIPQLRWYWQIGGKRIYQMLPFAETLENADKPGYAFLTQFLDDLSAVRPLLEEVMATESYRVELNFRRQHCRQIVLSLGNLLQTVQLCESMRVDNCLNTHSIRR